MGANKLSDDRVRAILASALRGYSPSDVDVSIRELEALAQEVLDLRTTVNMHEGSDTLAERKRVLEEVKARLEGARDNVQSDTTVDPTLSEAICDVADAVEQTAALLWPKEIL